MAIGRGDVRVITKNKWRKTVVLHLTVKASVKSILYDNMVLMEEHQSLRIDITTLLNYLLDHFQSLSCTRIMPAFWCILLERSSCLAVSDISISSEVSRGNGLHMGNCQPDRCLWYIFITGVFRVRKGIRKNKGIRLWRITSFWNLTGSYEMYWLSLCGWGTARRNTK